MKVIIRQKSGMKYLYADIFVSGLRYKSTLGISIKEGIYNLERQCVEGGSNTETNILIASFKKNIIDCVRRLQVDGTLSLETLAEGFKQIRDRLTAVKQIEASDIYLIPYIKKHIERSIAIRKEASIIQYNYCLNKLIKFEKHTKVRLSFNDINLDFYSEIMLFCMKHEKLATNSISKIIKNLKMWMASSYEEGIHTNTTYASRKFKKPSEDAENIYLSEDELLQIRYTPLPSTTLENVRDIFLLACYTGVRSQDYHKLNNLNRISDNMLKVRTEKTDEEVIIPLHPVAEYILAKYQGRPRIISNQKFNKYIKIVCRLAGIVELTTLTKTVAGKRVPNTKPKYDCVSSHTARRSFATNAYKAGVPTLSIMSITGHRTEKIFLKYVKVTKQEHALLSSVHPFFKREE
jgi:site-specific recombinase XerD